MRYSIWSGEQLVGYTDLDIHTETPTMRQGFIDPTPEGRPLLKDATGVWRAMADRKRAERARGGDKSPLDDELVTAALSRREALDLELHDEHGGVLECEFVRVYDLFDLNAGVVDEMGDTGEEEQADFEIYLSSLSPERGADALAERASTDAEVEALVAELLEQREEKELLGSGWPPPHEDPRWDTMQYQLQVHLKACFDDDTNFLGPTFTGSTE
jgi:hypothetical protein